MSSYGNFIDTIPDLETQLGITHRKYLHIAVRQAEYYGYEDAAAWFEAWKTKFETCIEGEGNVEYSNTREECSIGGENCFCRTYGKW